MAVQTGLSQTWSGPPEDRFSQKEAHTILVANNKGADQRLCYSHRLKPDFVKTRLIQSSAIMPAVYNMLSFSITSAVIKAGWIRLLLLEKGNHVVTRRKSIIPIHSSPNISCLAAMIID